MARARPGLEKAVTEILTRNGKNGKRLSFRQAERATGLSPATISELAKGNARTLETVRRFAAGFDEDENRLMLLAGFVPEDQTANLSLHDNSNIMNFSEGEAVELESDDRFWLERFGRALAKMPPGRDKDLWRNSMRQNTELIELFLETNSN